MATILHSYDCGAVQNTVTADLYDNGLLHIHGSGDIANYQINDTPWNDYINNIYTVQFDYGITKLGNYILANAVNVNTIIMNCNPPTLGTTPFIGIVAATIWYDQVLGTWTSTDMVANYAGSASSIWKQTYKKHFTDNALTYFWNKIRTWVNTYKADKTVATRSDNGLMSNLDKVKLDGISENSNNVEVTPIIQTGTKIATITVDGNDNDLYTTGSDVEVTPIIESGTKIATITVNGVETDIYSESGSAAVSYTPDLTAGTKIGTLRINGVDNDLYCASGSASISYTPTLTSGTKIGTLYINGVANELYCSSGSGPGSIQTLTIQCDGTTIDTFDGTTAKTINITKTLLNLNNVDNKSVNSIVSLDTYNSLNTSNKTLIGAINELYNMIDGVENRLRQI